MEFVLYKTIRQQDFEKNECSVIKNRHSVRGSAWFLQNMKLGKLHKEKSEAYKQRILLPAIRSHARSIVGRYTPEQLYSSNKRCCCINCF